MITNIVLLLCILANLPWLIHPNSLSWMNMVASGLASAVLIYRLLDKAINK